MAKSKEEILEKMKERIRTSGKYHRKGMENPRADPIEVVLQRFDKLVQSLLRAIEDGRLRKGLERALKEGRWKERVEIASKRWAESADLIVKEYEKQLDNILKCVSECQKKIEDLRAKAVTREERAEVSKEWQLCIGECWDKIKGIA